MQTEEFIKRVAAADEIGDTQTARTVTYATIEALCMHLSQEENRRMSSQLPGDLSKAALAGGQQAPATRESHVPLDTFYEQVATRAGMTAADVQGPARVVVHTLGKAITNGEFADVTFDLPPDLNTLLAS
ncbi:hypothetical protein SAOR_15225 [Salinisphaera orenii MK-B5]|uniref:DUF2267 domain-containing protein n=1 Tax=Salinisphaera orenii MK-B5 TaxID=856730 RepID=A0A423PG37_9GAMM|nr:DUF2267 domain-containing protein [Salinisphaera orenii]ROO24540.1 hypothetical protein SAOR_15225 [Salinisphaera orenii MK-B5]